jgi:predicted transcriptional regulator
MPVLTDASLLRRINEKASRAQTMAELPPPAERYQRRVSRGLSQQDLADYMGVRQSVISLWENGVRNPGPDYLGRYIRLLEILRETEAA